MEFELDESKYFCSWYISYIPSWFHRNESYSTTRIGMVQSFSLNLNCAIAQTSLKIFFVSEPAVFPRRLLGSSLRYHESKAFMEIRRVQKQKNLERS